MPKIVARAIRGRRRFFSYAGDRIQEQLKSFIQRRIAPGLKRELEDIVANWRNKPRFVPVTSVDRDEISLTFEAAGPNAKYWVWTSQGTRPHLIIAKRKPKLAFRRKYTPKTTPRPSWGGPGKSSGPWVTKRIVRHPGTTPRRFEQHIMRQNRARISREIEREFRRIVRGL